MIISLAVLALAAGLSADLSEGRDRLGVAAPELKLGKWINSPPLEIGDLKGKVVLLRWWTDTCSLCAATAPALRNLQSKYQSKGLQVIGIFHPKPPGDWNLERVRRASDRYQFQFPVALDGDWDALERWWMRGRERNYTSVSFLVDKKGVIRYVHPGGEYHEGGTGDHAACSTEFHAIDAMIQKLLAER